MQLEILVPRSDRWSQIELSGQIWLDEIRSDLLKSPLRRTRQFHHSSRNEITLPTVRFENGPQPAATSILVPT